MLIVILECAAPRLRGYCSSWGLQIAIGVYAITAPASHRDAIWGQLLQWAGPETRLTMVWGSAQTEQGVEWRSIGAPRRALVESEGLTLSLWLPPAAEEGAG